MSTVTARRHLTRYDRNIAGENATNKGAYNVRKEMLNPANASNLKEGLASPDQDLASKTERTRVRVVRVKLRGVGANKCGVRVIKGE